MIEPRWLTLNPSPFPWENEAINFVKPLLPDAPRHLARALFEFIADDGSVNEVDLLALTPVGLFLVEIKSWPGFVWGDAGSWSCRHDGRIRTFDNPLLSADRKAKRLRSILQRQKASQGIKIPFIEPLVFLSATDLTFDVTGNGRFKVCLRDRPAIGEEPGTPGIVAALLERRCPGLDPHRAPLVDRALDRALPRALEQAGIRPSKRSREVNGYKLDRVVQEGRGYQDWEAERERPHARRRVRVYLTGWAGVAEEREQIRRAAEREFALLEPLHHPNILRVAEWAEHDLGPVLLFESPAEALRLDHYLARKQGQLGPAVCLDLLRQTAEAVAYAHSKRVTHRALTPQAILVTNPDSDRPQVKLFNWQLGARASSSSSATVAPTEHADRFLDDAAAAYLAPETQRAALGEPLDVFSLGAIAFALFSGQPPAADGAELQQKLLAGHGLRLSSVANGVGNELEALVEHATHPNVSARLGSVDEFLLGLTAVEEELTAPDLDLVEDPRTARDGDQLPGGLTVRRRLGTGSCSVVLLVEREGQPLVLKVADEPGHNDRLEAEAEVIRKLRHPHVVQWVDTVRVGGRTGLLLRPVNEETLAERVRRDGPLNLDLLQRLGEDLLEVLKYLEQEGVAHRDIKPGNLGIAPLGQNARRHLVVFDFSLSRAPLENIRAGTRDYLDPFLPLRKPRAWDLHAERYAAAVTLHEMATGELPSWSADDTEPVHLPEGTEVDLQPERFDATVRDGLADFFSRALRRNPAERFDNAEVMLEAWRDIFRRATRPADREDESALDEALAGADLDTLVAELPLGAGRSVLDRLNVLTVRDLLAANRTSINKLKGVADTTRRRILDVQARLQARLEADGSDSSESGEAAESSLLALDALVGKLVTRRGGEGDRPILLALLGMDPMPPDSWPTLGDVAQRLGVERPRVGEALERAATRWRKNRALSAVRDEIARLLAGPEGQPAASAGVLSSEEVALALYALCGPIESDQPLRFALAVARAAAEAERSSPEPRFVVGRSDRPVFALRHELAEYGLRLGEQADELAALDPLASPTRALERLRAVTLPAGLEPLPDGRLVRLAAAASRGAAVSGRRELYPRGMDALRALRLSRGALVAPELPVAELKRRVAGRYPEAMPLPDEYERLHEMLHQVGLVDLLWNSQAADGAGAFVPRPTDEYAISSVSRSQQPPPAPTLGTVEIDPDTAVRRQFEERLDRALRDKSFLALMADHRRFGRVLRRLVDRHPVVRPIDLEALVLAHLKRQAEGASVRWEKVLAADADGPGSRGWKNLLRLVARAAPGVEAEVLASPQPILLHRAGLLARFDQMELLARLREASGRPGMPPGIWLLSVGDGVGALPVIDRQPVPVLSPGQRAAVPPAWTDFTPLTARRKSS